MKPRDMKAAAMSLCAAGVLTMAGGMFFLPGCDGPRGANGHAMHAGALHDDHSMRKASASHADQDHGAMDAAVGAHAHTTRLEFSAQPSSIPAGAGATWTLRIVDVASGKPVEEFEVVHEKLMHLIVVSTDLTWFNHLHPTYKGNGVFTIEATLPRDGGYKLYADYTPKGGSQEVAQYEFATRGAKSAPSSTPLSVDVLGTGGWMLKTVSARPEGEPEAPSAGEYQVAMMPMPSSIVAGEDVMLHFQVRDADGRPLTSLQPYLGAMGHAVLLSGATKTYLHTHPMSGDMHGHGDHDGASGDHAHAGHAHVVAKAGADVVFHTNFPTPGLYKVWGQFQHNGKILTAPFVLRVGA